MKNREIIQRVLSLYSAGVSSDDTRLSHRLAYSALLSCRNVLITNKLKKNQMVSAFAYQLLPCIQLEKADAFECPEIANTNAYILRSTSLIPDILGDMDKNLLSITSIDGSVNYGSIKFQSRSYTKGGKYTSKIVRPFLMPNKRLYLSIDSNLDAVAAYGLFKNPIEVEKFPKFCNPDTSCKSNLDYEFPIDGDLETPLIQLAADELINNFKKGNTDVQNNSRDDSQQG